MIQQATTTTTPTQPPPTPHRHLAMVLRECGICQTSICPDEQTTTCPKCSLVFHAECWQENFGCAAYGCEQVNALLPKAPEPEPEALPPPVERPMERLPWNFVLLGAAALSLLLSALTFGAPSLLVAIGVAARGWKLKLWNRHLLRDPAALLREPILIAAGVLAFAGMVVGPIVSTFWWLSSANG
ncbi:MAG TPA: hypothetical protein VER17_21315 [Tepidisphaeraceae bacterium]|nr:hypothetical protein [Tepidisphaeraceae bacterium]